MTTNRISIKCTERTHEIESVTVFQSGRAQVKRCIKLALKQGQNQIDVDQLPTCADEDSIRVDGAGAATILDVTYHNPHTQSNVPIPYDPFDQAVVKSFRDLEAFQKEREIVEGHSTLLSTYGQTFDSQTTNIKDVEYFLDMLGPRQFGLAKRIQELDMSIELAQKAYDEARAPKYVAEGGTTLKTRITVTMLADIDGEAELVITYVVSNASWKPVYDLRASIINSSDKTPSVVLQYQASITQTTGEDWSDIALTLSTTPQQVGNEGSKLSCWRIGLPSHAPQPRMSSAPPPPPARGAPASRNLGKEPTQLKIRSSQVVDTGILNATFDVSGRSHIPSDGARHKIGIMVLDLEAKLEWICIPWEKENVFVKCKLANTSEFTLLPGVANVFLDGNFVSKSQLEHIAPGASLDVSLGVDPALRVTYPPVRTLNKTAKPGFFSGKDSERSIIAYSQHMTLRNSRSSVTPKIQLLDHVPVSTDERLKVGVLAPVGLGPSEDHDWVDVCEGIKVRWANLDTGSEGTVEWACEVPPSETVELELAWEVSGPAGEKWCTLR